MGKVLSMELGTKEDFEKLNLNGPCVGPSGSSYHTDSEYGRVSGWALREFSDPLTPLKKEKGFTKICTDILG